MIHSHGVNRPVIIVLATPYAYASLIADSLRARGTYDVIVPDLAHEEWQRPTGVKVAGVISSMPVPRDIADVVVELPASFEQPLRITSDGLTVSLAVHIDRPIEDAIDAIDRLIFEDPRSPTRTER